MLRSPLNLWRRYRKAVFHNIHYANNVYFIALDMTEFKSDAFFETGLSVNR